jgi:hypothetical protein
MLTTIKLTIKMKKLFFLILLGSSFNSIAQVAIGKNTIDGSGILDFEENLKGGIVLPRVTQMPTQAAALTDGTILVNAVQLSNVKVQVRQNGAWVNLTDEVSLPFLDVNITPDFLDGTIIGSNTSTANGVLVLESTDKALILPKVINVNELRNAVIGTMFYDMASKSLAVFDGSKWIFWK